MMYTDTLDRLCSVFVGGSKRKLLGGLAPSWRQYPSTVK